MDGMFSRLPMLAISRGVRKPGPRSMARSCFLLFAHRLALSSGVWTACSSTTNKSPGPNLFCAHYATTGPQASGPPRPDVAHHPAVLLLGADGQRRWIVPDLVDLPIENLDADVP